MQREEYEEGFRRAGLPLLIVSGAVAVLSGLYYAIAVFTDGTCREEFLGEITEEMRETFRLRADYLKLIPQR